MFLVHWERSCIRAVYCIDNGRLLALVLASVTSLELPPVVCNPGMIVVSDIQQIVQTIPDFPIQGYLAVEHTDATCTVQLSKPAGQPLLWQPPETDIPSSPSRQRAPAKQLLIVPQSSPEKNPSQSQRHLCHERVVHHGSRGQ